MGRVIFFTMFKLVKEMFDIYNKVLNFQTRTSAYVVFTNNFFFFMYCLFTCVMGDHNAAPWRQRLVQVVCKSNIQVVYTSMRESSEKKGDL
jgi:hypothetical protein